MSTALTTTFASAAYKLTADETGRTMPIETAHAPLRVVTGRNDSADATVLLSADRDISVQIGCAAWFSQTLGKPTIRVEVLADFNVSVSHIAMHKLRAGAYHSGTYGTDTFRADALLHDSVIEVPGNHVHSLFLSAKIPADTKPGTYPLTVRFYETVNCSDETLIDEITSEIVVYDYLFPENKDSGFHLDLWQHPSNIARKHEVPLWSDAHFAVLEHYCRLLGEIGVNCVTVIASEIPWNGQWCHTMPEKANLYEYSMIGVTKQCRGTFVYDYSVMQRYIDLCAKYGICEVINVFGLVNVWNASFLNDKTVPDYPDCMHIRYYDEESRTYRYMRTGAEIDGYIRALETYFIETDQIDRVRISADEPHELEPFKENLERLHKNAPRFRCKTACDKPEFVDAFSAYMDDFVYDIETVSGKFDELQETFRAHPEKRFLYYVCCMPTYPNNFLRSDLCETYFQCIYASFLGVDGFLRWDFTVWGDEPRTDLCLGKWDAGDAFFVYPAYNGTPMDSLRCRALTRGIRYFVLLEDAKKRGNTALYDRVIDTVLREKDQTKLVTNPCKTDSLSCDHRDYEAAWEMLLSALS